MPYTSGNKKQDSCFFTGANGGGHGQAGINTKQILIRAISDKNYYSNNGMYFTIGNTTGGSIGEGNVSKSCGGGASFLAAGGNGGAPGIDGSDG
jgi:tRNA U34 2-thiouridine synthase MnmA/TrmU